MGRNSCSVCSKKCIALGSIYCETCGTCVHYRCDGIDGNIRRQWEKREVLGYVCKHCRCHFDGSFDYLMGLERLKQGARSGITKLRAVVKRELLFLEGVSTQTSLCKDFGKHRQDRVANEILTDYHTLKKMTALSSTGDGDCLFNAISILLVGNESRSVELRYRCCIEMVTGKENITNHPLYSRLIFLSQEYDKDCLDCTRLGSYSTAWRMMAISNALNIRIQSVYPYVNGRKYLASEVLNTVFEPPSADPGIEPIKVMWTNLSMPPRVKVGSKRKREWLPNHFVPLVDINCLTTSPTSATANCTSGSPIAGKSYAAAVSPPKSSPGSPAAKQEFNTATQKSTSNSSATKQYSTAATQKSSHESPAADRRPSAQKSTSDSPAAKKRYADSTQKCTSGSPAAKRTYDCASQKSTPDSPAAKQRSASGSSSGKQSSTATTDPSDSAAAKQKPTVDSPAANQSYNAATPKTSPTSSCDKQRCSDDTPTSTPKSPADELSPAKLSSPQSNGSILKDIDDDMSAIFEESDEDYSRVSNEEPFFVSVDTTSTCEDDNMLRQEDSDDEPFLNFQPGPLGNKFMDIRSVVLTFRRPLSTLPDIPEGRKDGFYFLVDNTENSEKRDREERSAFRDDCGPWKKAACPVSHYLFKKDKFVSIIQKNGEYCAEKTVAKKKVFIPLNPQPEQCDILEVQRLYQKLQSAPSGCKQFQRRITTLRKVPVSHQGLPTDVALVEYIGTFPPRKFHGNVKHFEKNKKYIRTKESVKQTLKDQLKHRSVKEVERRMNKHIDHDEEKQRDSKQLENLKYRQERASRPSEKVSNNAADHVIIVEEMTKTHPFVKCVKHMKDVDHPVITLFTDQQITDIKRFCCKPEGATPLGIDRTYNIGDFYVTPTVYKDLSVLRRASLDHPLCFGPTYLHTKSTSKVYSSFMHDIADNLSDIEMTNLTIGSDEENAFKSAISRCFAGCTHILCTSHLKRNLNDYMEDKSGYPENHRNEILNDVFGIGGLTESTDIDTYNRRLSRLQTKIDAKDASATLSDKNLRSYFDRKFAPLVYSHVVNPTNQGKCSVNWTNNNCESGNHILKSATHWKTTDIPKFIELLFDIVTCESIERSRAIRDTGNFKLHINYAHHLVDIDRWTNFPQERKNMKISRFRSDKGRERQNITISTDGTRSVKISASAGKKTDQTKRKRAERSRTPKTAKRRLLSCNGER